MGGRLFFVVRKEKHKLGLDNFLGKALDNTLGGYYTNFRKYLVRVFLKEAYFS